MQLSKRKCIALKMYQPERIDSPWPIPIPPISRIMASCVNMSRTIPFALHWYNRPLGPPVIILHASCPWCCSSNRPSHISSAALTVVLCKRRPRILHTVKQKGKWKKKRHIQNRSTEWKQQASLFVCFSLIFVQWNRDVEKEIQTPTESRVI